MAGQKIDIKATLLRLKMWITHNWPWKLLSLFLAICLWSGLITQDESLTREKVFNDVTINIVNADTLRRNARAFTLTSENGTRSSSLTCEITVRSGGEAPAHQP